jgi:hypothetical protein
VLAKSHTKTLDPRRKIVDPYRMELHYDRSVDFGSVVECSAENKVGSAVANVTIPGKPNRNKLEIQYCDQLHRLSLKK